MHLNKIKIHELVSNIKTQLHQTACLYFRKKFAGALDTSL